MNEILVIELKIPWRYDLGWDGDFIKSQRIEFIKSCIQDTAAVEATFTKADTVQGVIEYNHKIR